MFQKVNFPTDRSIQTGMHFTLGPGGPSFWFHLPRFLQRQNVVAVKTLELDWGGKHFEWHPARGE